MEAQLAGGRVTRGEACLPAQYWSAIINFKKIRNGCNGSAMRASNGINNSLQYEFCLKRSPPALGSHTRAMAVRGHGISFR